ncbi:hypothetical protein [Rothia sp. ZJ1223]|uniref:hypothetical protein n=1 Tax=Rothia sp. ZJ1223 TaxID=2811098 RepID=UPI0019560A5D|nr:hypothetical protein [Rothia sp. ZJ1223]MBM7052102.1 hypothetical protein [Rothia sp. ZJ1223]
MHKIEGKHPTAGMSIMSPRFNPPPSPSSGRWVFATDRLRPRPVMPTAVQLDSKTPI